MAEHSRVEVSFAQGDKSDEGRVCFPSVIGTCRYLVESLPIHHACECSGYLGSIQECFLGHYIPPSLMAIKHTEFMKLTQGTKSLNEYCRLSITGQGMLPSSWIPMQRRLLASREGLAPN
jgi:hypothetical protein